MSKLILQQRFVEITIAPQILSKLIGIEQKEPIMDVAKEMKLGVYMVNPSITLVSLSELSTLSSEPEPSDDVQLCFEKHSMLVSLGGIKLLTGLGESDSKKMLQAINKHFHRIDILNAPCSLFDLEAFLFNRRIDLI